MNGAKFRLVGFGLLSGAALAVGCGGDEGGGNDSGGNGTTSTTSAVTTTIGGVTNSVNSATSSQSTNGTSNGTVSGTTGTGATGSVTGTGTTGTGTTGSTTGTGTTGTGTTGTGTTGSTTGTSTTGSTTGSGGSGGTCEDDAPAPTGGNAGGAGGEGGASGGGELTEGFNFVAESEVAEWSIMACADDATDCVDDAGASIGFTCGVLRVEIEWPEAANTAAAKLQIQNVVSESMLHDLSGKTLYARLRMTSEGVAGHGYDFNVIAQDYIDDDDDGNDWKWFSTCYNGSGNCPENPSGEAWAPGDGWVLLALPMDADLAPDGFAFNGIRKFAIEIATKHWADGEPFSYDAAPTSFEIDYVAW